MATNSLTPLRMCCTSQITSAQVSTLTTHTIHPSQPHSPPPLNLPIPPRHHHLLLPSSSLSHLAAPPPSPSTIITSSSHPPPLHLLLFISSSSSSPCSSSFTPHHRHLLLLLLLLLLLFLLHCLLLPPPPPSVDWVVVEVLCLKQGWSGGRTRYILKDAIRYLPLYGLVLGEVGDRASLAMGRLA